MYALAASSFCLSTQLFDTSGCGPVSRIFNCYDPDRSYKNKSVSLEAYIKHLQKNHCDVTNPANPESCSDPDSSYVPASTYVPTSTCPGVTQTPVVTQTCGTLQRVQQWWTKVWLILQPFPEISLKHQLLPEISPGQGRNEKFTFLAKLWSLTIQVPLSCSYS